MIELRLILIDSEHPDRTFAYRFSRQDEADFLRLKYRETFGSEDPVPQMRARERRRDIVTGVVALLGSQMADFMNDRDGFNGERRSELIERIERDA